MISKKEAEENIIRLQDFKTLIQTYEEIAANRMSKNRSMVLASRYFAEGLVSIYQELKTSYQAQVMHLMQQKDIKKLNNLSLIKRNGKTICLLLSSNTGLYGDIIPKVTGHFLSFARKVPCDIAVIGKLGRQLVEDSRLGKKPYFFDLPDISPSQEQLDKLAKFLINYEKIYIFYGKFESIGVQRPTILDVSGENLEQSGSKGPHVQYLFEPSLEQVMVFFEEQIFSAIIEQAFKESELAKFASRMITLDAALENASDALKKAELEKRILIHRANNKKQQEQLNGLSLAI